MYMHLLLGFRKYTNQSFHVSDPLRRSRPRGLFSRPARRSDAKKKKLNYVYYIQIRQEQEDHSFHILILLYLAYLNMAFLKQLRAEPAFKTLK